MSLAFMPGAACGADSERNDEKRKNKEGRGGGGGAPERTQTDMHARESQRGQRRPWGCEGVGHEASSADRQSREHTQVVAAVD